MGCDIHLRVERRNAGGDWEIVKPGLQPYPYGEPGTLREDWPTERQYRFFSLVAGVRRRDHETETPIAEGRGLPADMASKQYANDQYEEYEDADAAGLSDLGDHSFTWATLKELQDGLQSHRHEIDESYIRLIYEEWPKLSGDPENVRIIMGFDS